MAPIDPGTAGEAISGAIAAIGAVYGLIKHLTSRSKRKHEAYRQSILDEAKGEARRFKEELEAKVAKVESELRAKQESLELELAHTKDIYNSEIKILGQRIQELRQDISSQHANLVALLTKLVNSK